MSNDFEGIIDWDEPDEEERASRPPTRLELDALRTSIADRNLPTFILDALDDPQRPKPQTLSEVYPIERRIMAAWYRAEGPGYEQSDTSPEAARARDAWSEETIRDLSGDPDDDLWWTHHHQTGKRMSRVSPYVAVSAAVRARLRREARAVEARQADHERAAETGLDSLADGGSTLAEVATALGLSEKRTRERLQAWRDRGFVVVGQRPSKRGLPTKIYFRADDPSAPQGDDEEGSEDEG